MFQRGRLWWHVVLPLRWRHTERDSVSNHQPHGCLLNGLLRRRSKKTSKLRVTGLCVGNSPGPVNSPHKGASYAEDVSIWWRQHDTYVSRYGSIPNSSHTSNDLGSVSIRSDAIRRESDESTFNRCRSEGLCYLGYSSLTRLGLVQCKHALPVDEFSLRNFTTVLFHDKNLYERWYLYSNGPWNPFLTNNLSLAFSKVKRPLVGV